MQPEISMRNPAADGSTADLERRIAELTHELAVSRQQFRNIVEQSIQGIAVLMQSGFVFVNDAFCQMFGYRREELLGAPPWLLHPSNREELAARAGARASGDASNQRYAIRGQRKDGSVLWVEYMTSVVEWKGERATQLVAIDITTRRLAEEALKERESTYRGLVDNSIQGIVVMADRKTVFVNEACCRMFGVTTEEFLAAPSIFDFYHPSERERLESYANQRDAGDRSRRRFEVMGLRRDGGTFWIEQMSSVIDWNGTPAVQAVMIDVTERKKAELLLAVRERMYRETFENAPMAMFRAGSDHAVIEVNRALEDLLGYAADELRGKRLRMLIHPDDVEKVLALMLEVLEGRVARVDNEYRVRRKDGRYIWVSSSRCLTPDEDGQLNHLLVQLQDITARRQAEAALQEREAVYRALAEESLQGLMVAERGKPAFVNGVFARMFGYTVDEILAMRSSAELYHPEDRAKIEAFIRLRHEGDRSVRRYECRCIRKDGTVFWIEQLTSPVDWFARRATQVVTIDISERKLAEQMLAESERQYREMFENAPVAMSWVSARGRFIRTNHAMQEMLGYTAEELGHIGPLECVHAEHRDAARRAIDSILNGSKDSVVEEITLCRKDGWRVWVLASVRVIRGPAGEARYILVQFQDITGRKNAEEQLFQAQKMEALGNFAGGIAHDFNNLLLPIIALTEIARDEMPNESPTKENLEMVLSAAHQASRLVKQILTFSRRSERHIDAVDISHCIGDALSLLRNVLPSTIKLRDEIAPDVGTVMADRAQLQSVIMNLGGNAADAMQDKGELTVSLARLSADAELAARQPLIKNALEYAKITVTDTGSGMDRATLEKIFNPFFTTKPVGEGSGLGLSMVHGIIEDLEGAIEVTSALGVGTTFEIYLPLTAQPARPAAAPHPAELAEKSR